MDFVTLDFEYPKSLSNKTITLFFNRRISTIALGKTDSSGYAEMLCAVLNHQ